MKLSVFWHLLLVVAICFPLIAVGSVNEPMRWEWQTGYRNDTLHWHLQDPTESDDLIYSEHYRNLQFWENTLSIRVIYRDIAVFAKGASAFGHGSFKQRFSSLPTLILPASAWTIDGWGYFGYSVNLTADRIYKVILVPFFGYGANAEQLNRHEIDLNAREHMCWFGPLLGGFFLIEPGNSLQFEAGYAYHHWLHLRFSSKFQLKGQEEKLKVTDGSNLAHSGWTRFDIVLSKCWKIGLFAQVEYFASRVLNVNLKNQVTSMSMPEKYKARWTAVSGALTLSRTF